MTRRTAAFLAMSLFFHNFANIISDPPGQPTTSVLSKTGEGCAYTVYEGGDGTGNIVPIPTIQAAVPSCVIVEALGGSTATLVKNSHHIANAMMHATNAVKGFTGALADVAPKLAPVLGLLGVGLGFMNQLTQVTPAQIIAETNRAFDSLVNEMNHRLDVIADYVDQQDRNLHKQIISDFLRGDQDRWTRSVQFTSRSLVDEQQRIAETSIYAHRHLYMNRAKFVSGGDLSAREIQTLEMQLVSLKSHVDLHLTALATLISTYKDGNSEGGLDQWRQYRRIFVDYGNEYVNYVDWAYNQIHRKRVPNLHLSSWPYTCSEPKRHMVTFQTIYLASTDQTCSVVCNTFQRPKKCEVSLKFKCHNLCQAHANVDVKPLRDLIQREANDICRPYIRNLNKDVVNYWRKEIFNISMPSWRESIRLVQEGKDPALVPIVTGKARNIADSSLEDEERNALDEKITQGLSSAMPMNEYLERLLDNYKSLEVKRAIKEIGGENGIGEENENVNENQNEISRASKGESGDESKNKIKNEKKKRV